jgi:hypothetical protein
MFDRTGQIIDHDEMAHRKWLIDQDREGREQIAQDIL